MSRVFLSHRTLDRWLDDAVAEVRGEALRLQALPEVIWRLESAVYFLSNDGNQPSAEEFVGRVQSTSRLDEMGAEHFGTAVVMGEMAWTVKPGFFCEPYALDGRPCAVTQDFRRRLLAALEASGYA